MTDDLGRLKKEVALDLFAVGAIKCGPPGFRLKLHDTQPDAPLSPIYINLRVIRSYPKVLKRPVALYLALAKEFSFESIADVPTASTPIVTLMCANLDVPMITPRLEARTHGLAAQIDGAWEVGQRCLVVDDLITRSHSKLEAIKALESQSLKVSGVAVLIDREQGGIAELGKQGYRCVAAYGLRDLLAIYAAEDLISEKQQGDITAYLAAAAG